jgi:hypothetical protein
MTKTHKTFSQLVNEGLQRAAGKELTVVGARRLAIRLLVEDRGGFPPPSLYAPLADALVRA